MIGTSFACCLLDLLSKKEVKAKSKKRQLLSPPPDKTDNGTPGRESGAFWRFIKRPTSNR